MLEKVLDYEHDLFLWLNGGHTPFGDHFLWLYTGREEGFFVWSLAGLWIIFMLAWKRPWKETLLVLLMAVLVVAACDQIASVCKMHFERPRPTHHDNFGIDVVKTVNDYLGGPYGFISGHAATSFGFALFTLLLFRNRWYTCIILLWSLGMIYSRIYLGVHFISDIIPGVLVGIVFGTLGYYLYRLMRRKLFPATADRPVCDARRAHFMVYGIGLAMIVLALDAAFRL